MPSAATPFESCFNSESDIKAYLCFRRKNMKVPLRTAATSLGLFAVHLLLTSGVAAQTRASAPGRLAETKVRLKPFGAMRS
jgi:hypothetical protein